MLLQVSLDLPEFLIKHFTTQSIFQVRMPQKEQSWEEKKFCFYSIYSHLVNAALFTLSVSPFSRSIRLSRNCLSHLSKPMGFIFCLFACFAICLILWLFYFNLFYLKIAFVFQLASAVYSTWCFVFLRFLLSRTAGLKSQQPSPVKWARGNTDCNQTAIQ